MLRLRIAFAIFLVIFSHAVLLAAAVGFLWFGIHSATTLHGGLLVGICSILTGAMILFVLWPHAKAREPHGTCLTPELQPELFALVRDAAAATGEEAPSEVWLTWDCNAFVRKDVMGIGLPLLPLLTVSQLRGILAHELAHAAAGHLAFGAWVHRTRNAMVEILTDTKTYGWPYTPYARLFLRVTQAVVREQELAADRIAARIAGASTYAAALRIVHRAHARFHHYWMREVAPVLESGFRPPIAAGFAEYAVDIEPEPEEPNPYDSHPMMWERLAVVAEAGDRAPEYYDPPAIALLRGVTELERAIFCAEHQSHLLESLLPRGEGPLTSGAGGALPRHGGASRCGTRPLRAARCRRA
jgi:Zn-dependent protease with chaperone function